jgi:hypothetical protein
VGRRPHRPSLRCGGPAGAAPPRTLVELRETAARIERPAALGELEITITPPGPIDVDVARRYADLGVHRLALQPHTMEGSVIEELITTVGETLVGRV